MTSGTLPPHLCMTSRTSSGKRLSSQQTLLDRARTSREVNARNKEEEEDSEGKQFTIKWRPDIVEVKFIETESVLTHLQHRNVEETINGLRFNSASNLYLKTESESDDQRVKTQHFIEKICDIDDLCLEDKGSEDCDTFPREDQSTFLHPPVLKRPDVSPVVEEISKLSTNDNDTASEISEIPTDDEKEEEEICSVEKTLERNNCDNEQVPSATKPKSPTSQQSLEEAEEVEGNYSSFDDETNSLATTASEGSYCSQTSTIQSSSYDGVSSSPQFTDQVNVVDRSKKQKSPSHSLHASRTNEETKTSSRHDNSGKEVKPDNKGIGEEIKVEFERQHKYIRSRDFVKKSPEDSGFESFQQSSVEQNSNQNSDDDDVIATFSTVMEVDNETSAVQDLDKNFTSYSTDKYTTGGLFADAEEARARSRRLREQSIQQLGVHLKKTANSCPPPPVPAWEKSSDSRRQVRNEGDSAVCLCEDSDTLVKLRVSFIRFTSYFLELLEFDF